MYPAIKNKIKGYLVQTRDLDGNIVKFKALGSENLIQSKSSLHLKCRELLKEKYPTIRILEEVAIPLRKKEILFCDFYIPLLKKFIEVQGEQHSKYCAHFHQSPQSFAASKKRDAEKKQWCEQNGFEFVELRFDEINKWKEQI